MRRSTEGFPKSSLIVGLLWVNFIFLWGRVYQVTTFKDVTDSLASLYDLLIIYGLVVALWVIHNIRIYRTKGPRLRPRWVGFSDTRDCLNQQINKGVDLEHEQEIVINVIRAEKSFLGTASIHEVVLTTTDGK